MLPFISGQMEFSADKIVAFIRQKSHHPMKLKELAQALSIPKPQYAQFRTVIKQLINSGELVRLKRGRIGIASEMDMLVGPVSIVRSGMGFVERPESDKGERDIMIPANALSTALDGDKVMVRLTGQSDGRQLGTVVRVVERSERNIVGVFNKGPHFAYVTPDNPRIHRDIYIPSTHQQKAQNGEKVVCKLIEWEDPHLNPIGDITERIGFPGEPGVDMLTVIKSYELPEEFPDDVLDEAERITAAPMKEEYARREDLSSECIYTIDPADAKDHDDAVSVEKTAGGYRLGVHIADVSHYVQPGTALDKEAFERGNSVYLPGMVIPMLPEILSNNTCSLKPNRKRLAFSVVIDFDDKGKALSWRLTDTVVKSAAKLAYEEVQEFFDHGLQAGRAADKIKRVADNLTLARELALKLNKRRFAEGSLDFDLPEAKIILNKQGEVIELGNRIRLESHRLVEEFMLAANKAVALEVFRRGQQFLYRVHGRPDLEKIEHFSAMMSRLGYNFPVSPTIRPVDLARFLKKVQDAPEIELINELMLRSMQKAVYQRKNIGHFGLAFKHYTHFTSPIRRYPDLLVHRLLRTMDGGQYPPAFAKRIPNVIDRVGKHCSETERTAESAEREAVKVKQVQYMERHIGDQFGGVISGVTGFGFFVRIDNLGAEGLVRISTIDDDYYRFDESQFRLVGRRTGSTYRLGDQVQVGVLKVDRTKNEIELYAVPSEPKERTGPRSEITTPRSKKRREKNKKRRR